MLFQVCRFPELTMFDELVSRLRTRYPMRRRLDVISRRAMHTELSMPTVTIHPTLQGYCESTSMPRHNPRRMSEKV